MSCGSGRSGWRTKVSPIAVGQGDGQRYLIGVKILFLFCTLIDWHFDGPDKSNLVALSLDFVMDCPRTTAGYLHDLQFSENLILWSRNGRVMDPDLGQNASLQR